MAGWWPSDQFPAVLQLPPLPLVKESVAARAGSGQANGAALSQDDMVATQEDTMTFSCK